MNAPRRLPGSATLEKVGAAAPGDIEAFMVRTPLHMQRPFRQRYSQTLTEIEFMIKWSVG